MNVARAGLGRFDFLRVCVCNSEGFTLVELVMVVAILAVVASFVMLSTAGVRERAEAITASASLHSLRDAVCGTPEAPGYLADMKRVPGFQAANMRLHDLLSPSSYPDYVPFDPQSGRGWRGPYVQNAQPVRNANVARSGQFPEPGERRWPGDATFLERAFYRSATVSDYGQAGDLVIADPWGNPFVLQVPSAESFTIPAGDAKRLRYARLISAGEDGRLQTPRDRTAGMQPDGSCTARGDDLVLFLNRADVYESEEP
jgi:prepilin-type N-terminal cleavage/methylation domain-containing protein